MALNFKISELIKSDTAIRMNINNMPDINQIDICIGYVKKLD